VIQSRRLLLFALIFPIAGLAALTAYKKYILSFGQEVVLPISGYDPRDLLSGHYLTYRVDYGLTQDCYSGSMTHDAYVCLDTKSVSYSYPDGCERLIKGQCRGSRFEAGIEKFYVPEDKAKILEDKVRDKSGSIVLSVTRDGRAQVKDLLIDGKSWRDFSP
jgi:uncharacterized membrane-anchored protein